jgi:hypothetical protein
MSVFETHDEPRDELGSCVKDWGLCEEIRDATRISRNQIADNEDRAPDCGRQVGIIAKGFRLYEGRYRTLVTLPVAPAYWMVCK